MNRQPEPELMIAPEVAKAYADADFADVNERFVERIVEIADEAGVPEHGAVLDLGTGPGDIPLRLLERCPSWRITALDGSAAMLDLAREATERAGLATEAVRWVLADIRNTGLEPASFDLIISNSLLHHLHDPFALWRSILDLGRPGAAVLVRDLLRPLDSAAAQFLVDQHVPHETDLLRREFFNSLLAAFTIDEIRVQLTMVGLGHWDIAAITDRHLDIWGSIPG